jgi:ribosome maturation factor RimP
MEYYRTQIEEIAKRICAEKHLALYDIDEKFSQKGRIIIVYLTRIGGVTLDECASFSRALSQQLDDLDFIPERYFWKCLLQESSALSSLKCTISVP